MDFKVVISKLLAAFKEHNISYALMGGFAIGLWGGGRTTIDIDFLVNRDDMAKVDAIMQELGYECKYRTENVSQYISALKIFGEVDFLHAFREASLQMLDRAEEKKIFDGELTIKTLIPEDLIGLKLQAIRNNPEREENDMADIRMLIQIHKDNINWQLVENYFKIFEMKDLYEKIFRRIK